LKKERESESRSNNLCLVVQNLFLILEERHSTFVSHIIHGIINDLKEIE